jgi:hypothetical protein
MENRMKNLLLDRYFEVLSLDNTFGLTQPQKRQIANLLSSSGSDIHEDNFKILSELYQELVLSDEKTRKQFIGMINFIEKNTKVILDSFKAQGFIKIEYNALKKKSVVKARTDMLLQVADYLNVMNDLVISFYTDVYKIEKVNEKEKDFMQTKLF